MISSYLYKDSHDINQYIKMRIPTVREVINNEEDYFTSVSVMVATPYDMMVQLDDMGIDFTTVTDWDLFLNLFEELKHKDLHLIFDNINLGNFCKMVNPQNGMVVLYDNTTGAIIDKEIYQKICRFIRKLLQLEKNDKRPANSEAKKFMIDRARKKQQRLKNKEFRSQLENIIISLVNTSEFQYTYESILDLNIYQLYASFHQINKKIAYDNLMIGVYAGTVNTKEIDHQELIWMANSNSK